MEMFPSPSPAVTAAGRRGPYRENGRRILHRLTALWEATDVIMQKIGTTGSKVVGTAPAVTVSATRILNAMWAGVRPHRLVGPVDPGHRTPVGERGKWVPRRGWTVRVWTISTPRLTPKWWCGRGGCWNRCARTLARHSRSPRAITAAISTSTSIPIRIRGRGSCALARDWQSARRGRRRVGVRAGSPGHARLRPGRPGDQHARNAPLPERVLVARPGPG